MSNEISTMNAPYRVYDKARGEFHAVTELAWDASGELARVESQLGMGRTRTWWKHDYLSSAWDDTHWQDIRVDRGVGIYVNGHQVYENDLVLFTYKGLQWVAYIGYEQGAYTINHPWFGHITAKGLVTGKETAFQLVNNAVRVNDVHKYEYTSIKVLTMAIPWDMTTEQFAHALS